MLHDVKYYLLFLVIIMFGFAAAFHILFRQDQKKHDVSGGIVGYGSGCTPSSTAGRTRVRLGSVSLQDPYEPLCWLGLGDRIGPSS